MVGKVDACGDRGSIDLVMAVLGIPDESACSRCRLWDRQESTPGDEIAYGLCRRFPPGDNGWPATCVDDWCGEFLNAAGR